MKRISVRVLRRLCLFLAAVGLLTCASTKSEPVQAPPEQAAVTPPVQIEEKDLVYATVGDQELGLDLIHPEDAGMSLPLVVFDFGSEHTFHAANRINLSPAAHEPARRVYAAAAAALNAAGVPHTLVVVPGASHYMDRVVDFTSDGPLWSFLDQNLRGGN